MGCRSRARAASASLSRKGGVVLPEGVAARSILAVVLAVVLARVRVGLRDRQQGVAARQCFGQEHAAEGVPGQVRRQAIELGGVVRAQAKLIFVDRVGMHAANMHRRARVQELRQTAGGRAHRRTG